MKQVLKTVEEDGATNKPVGERECAREREGERREGMREREREMKEILGKALARESLLKGKDQYGVPPCTK
jgi:hypothetical protein